MRWLILFLATGLVLVSSIGAYPRPDAAVKAIKPIVQFGGSDSTIMKKGFFRCATHDEWNTLWKQHRDGNSPIRISQYMSVDFDVNMVVAFFQGDCGFDEGYGLHQITESDGHITMRFVLSSVQTGDGLNGLNPLEKIKSVEPINRAVSRLKPLLNE